MLINVVIVNFVDLEPCCFPGEFQVKSIMSLCSLRCLILIMINYE